VDDSERKEIEVMLERLRAIRKRNVLPMALRHKLNVACDSLEIALSWDVNPPVYYVEVANDPMQEFKIP
jgi:hypothetical protein